MDSRETIRKNTTSIWERRINKSISIWERQFEFQKSLKQSKAKVEIESNELDNKLKRQDHTIAYIHKRNEFVKAGIAPRDAK